jgi:hypothetical protein
MSLSDEYPTCYDLEPITDDELKTPPSPSHAPSITDHEVKALKAVDLAQEIIEPMSVFSAARLVIRGTALLARRRRS